MLTRLNVSGFKNLVDVDTPTLINECVMRLSRQTFPGHVLAEVE